MKLHRVIALALVLTVACAGPRLMAQEAQPAVVSAIAPFYPPIALAVRVSGEVSVTVTVNASGDVTSALSEQGHPLLREAGKRAAKRWKFAPAARPDAGERTAYLTFVFLLVGEDVPPSDITPIFYPPYKIEVTKNIPVIKQVYSY